MKVSQLGERGVIDLIWSVIKKEGGSKSLKELVLPPSDDASAVRLEDGRYLVLKTDMFVKHTDAPKGMHHRQMGAKAVTINISDLAAKGAYPFAFLFSLGLPKNYNESNVRSLISGINAAARQYGAPILGGDVGEARDLIVAGFAAGFSRHPVKRSGAHIGDIVAVTGPFGDTAAAYKILLEGLKAPQPLRKTLCRSVFEPRARLEVGVALVDSGLVTSSMDSSDGLAFTLNELAIASNVGLIIDNPPISKSALQFASLHKLSAEDLALFGGEEYEIVVTVKKGGWDTVLNAAKNVGGNLIRIGEVISGKKVVMIKGSKEVPIPARGWEHLK
jgi:thiamine-monophosphate kinase